MESSASVAFLSALAVDSDLIHKLSELPFSDTGTRRICLHQSETSPLHVMLVESLAGSSFPAHFHSDGDEVSFIVSGELELLVWSNGAEQDPEQVILESSRPSAVATVVPKGTTHITRARGGNCIYMEVKLGPFQRDALQHIDEKTLTGI